MQVEEVGLRDPQGVQAQPEASLLVLLGVVAGVVHLQVAPGDVGPAPNDQQEVQERGALRVDGHQGQHRGGEVLAHQAEAAHGAAAHIGSFLAAPVVADARVGKPQLEGRDHDGTPLAREQVHVEERFALGSAGEVTAEPLDRPEVAAQVDARLQRPRDLREVEEGASQTARKGHLALPAERLRGAECLPEGGFERVGAAPGGLLPARRLRERLEGDAEGAAQGAQLVLGRRAGAALQGPEASAGEVCRAFQRGLGQAGLRAEPAEFVRQRKRDPHGPIVPRPHPGHVNGR